MKGYKGTNEEMICQYENNKSYKYKLVKTHIYEGKEYGICKGVFHFCEKLKNCFDYYKANGKNRLFEVECDIDIQTEDNKSVCKEIMLVKEVIKDKAFWLLSVKQYGYALKYADEILKKDKDFIDSIKKYL